MLPGSLLTRTSLLDAAWALRIGVPMQVSVRCWSSGLVLISGEAWRAGAGGGSVAGADGWLAPACNERIQLPARIDTRSVQALFTQAGQLYVRLHRKD
jgi:hypothetical protein